MAVETLGKYRLLGLLAAGGMGEVFLAEQEGPHGFRRRVVVKRLLRHLASDAGFVEMFLNEARVAALVAHPNVAQIIELGEADGAPFIVMEWVKGQSLRQVLKALRARNERMPARVAAAVLIGVLHGLHAAHTLIDDQGNLRGCVHRDVSAENVLLSVDGAVKVVDFGIAKAISASNAQGTALRGKYGYLAPEQYRRDPLDARTDVFACGILFFELLTGSRPFVAESEAAVMNLVLNEGTPLLPPLPAASPASLDAVLARALAKDPAERFPSAEAMAQELEALVAAGDLGDGAGALREFARTWVVEPAVPEGSVARTNALAENADPTAPEEQTVRDPPPRRRAMVAGAVVAIAASAVAGGLTLWWRRPRPEPPSAVAVVVAPPAPTSPAESAEASAAPPPPSAPAPPTTAGSSRRRPDARPVRVAAASAEKATGAGTLAFRIRPWAEIFVDGKSLGVTPLAPVDLPVGRHHVLLRNTDLGKERSLTTNVTRGETTTLRVDLLE